MVSIPDRAYLSRKEAAQYLTDKWFPISHRTLAAKATGTDGPVYRIMGANAVYTRADLDTWARAQPRDPGPSKPAPLGALSSFRSGA